LQFLINEKLIKDRRMCAYPPGRPQNANLRWNTTRTGCHNH